jgi:hypothetical protein
VDFKVGLKQSPELCGIALLNCAEDGKDCLAIFLLVAEHLPLLISVDFEWILRNRASPKHKCGHQEAGGCKSDTPN